MINLKRICFAVALLSVAGCGAANQAG
ncbi:MAG: hypothetical protein JWM53_2533, partial [bacterium]|nr:hypothetical protein [bacterium]